MQPRGRGDIIWGSWLAASLVSFAVLETIAFRRETFPTLSRVLAAWLGIDPVHRHGRPRRAAFVLAWIALTVHLHTQTKRVVTAVVSAQPQQ